MPEPASTARSGRLSELEVHRGLRVNILAGSIGMMFVSVAAGVPLTMLLEQLGATGVQMGLIVTLQQSTMLVQIPAAFLAGRLSRRKPYWAALALVHRILWFGPALLPLLLQEQPQAAVWSVIACVSLSAAFAQLTVPVWFAWMADLVPPREGGRFWGLRQSVTTLAFVFMSAFSGWLLDRFAGPSSPSGSYAGFSIVFSIATLLGAMDIIVHLWVPEPPAARAAAPPRILPQLRAIAGQRDFRLLTLAMGAWFFALGVTGALGNVYLKRDFGLTYSHLAVLQIAGSLGAVAAGVLFGYVIDRIGPRVFGLILMAAGPLLGAAWFFIYPGSVRLPGPGGGWMIPQPVALLSLTNFLAGGLYSGVGLCQINLLGALAPRESRTVAMAVHWTTLGAIGMLGPLFGGWAMDHFAALSPGWRLPSGPEFSFFHALVLAQIAAAWGLAAPLLSGVSRRREEPSLADALTRLLPPNPLRTFGYIHSVWQAAASTSAESRARAVQRLGDHRAALPVRDLIGRLEDPDPDVREAAALALGRIGSPEAVHALVAELEDPESDLAPQVARALRGLRDPSSVDALVRRLRDDDRDTLSESARTLGEIGDHRAAGPLRELLQHTADSKVVVASSAALSRLGEIAAIYDILPRMKATRNPVLRRTLAVAVADLLGEPGEFYGHLVREEETRGIEASRLLDDLRRSLEGAGAPGEDAPREHMLIQLPIFLAAYERDDVPACGEALWAVGAGLARLLCGGGAPGETPERLMARVQGRDPRFALGLWYLDLLRQHWDPLGLGHRDRTDILLGLYVVACARRRHHGRPR